MLSKVIGSIVVCKNALQQANADNDGNAIAYIHAQLDTIDAWTIQARASALLHGLGFSQRKRLHNR